MSKHTITTTIQSKTNTYNRTLTFLTIPTISAFIPDQPIDRTPINIPKNIQLADPTFHIPAPVDLLLGAGVALSLLSVGQINLSPPNGPDLFLQKNRLGWIIGGSAPASKPTQSTICHATTTIQDDLARFWELEEGPQIQRLSDAERFCEEHFQQNVHRNSDGRYVVALPFNDKLPQLGESKSRALKRLLALERRLQHDQGLSQQYGSVLQEYQDLGHMSEVQDTDEINDGFYLPHHGVTKTSSDTTKLRVVFDGSAATTTGVSLNETLHVGPKVQDNLLYILIRFRSHRYVLNGDIEKMYRQFLIRPEDRKYQRVLWRDPAGNLKTYTLNTVTFGLSAAPYLAIRCLSQLAQDEGHRFPDAAQSLVRDFYVDDLLTGAPTVQGALALRDQMIQLLNSAGLQIRQWASNHKPLLHGLPEQHINKRLHLGESSTIKTLGVVWDSTDDTIRYSVTNIIPTKSVTKRSISSVIARIYDPLGLLGPVIIVAKILLQKIWTMKIDWDESLPMTVHTEWVQFCTQLSLLNNVTFHRNTLISEPTSIELHGFCDASERAYGACIYLRSRNADGHYQVELLLAKSKVAPLKTQSIPRLELCGAILLTSLATTAQKALHVTINRICYWTDSAIVLHWLRTSPHLLKTFVANRVAEIQGNTNIEDWRHVPTADNPADIISRGRSPEEFLQPSIWHHGPRWLQEEETHWPSGNISCPNDLPEQKTVVCLTTTCPDVNFIERFSSWGRLIRVIAYCLRWKHSHTAKGALTASELKYAHDVIIKLIQRMHYTEEMKKITTGNGQTLKGGLQRLNPFIDRDGLLRVGGRLKNSFMPFGQRHPIILPKTRVLRPPFMRSDGATGPLTAETRSGRS
ncbi:uncharacterized protein LOC123987949 [Osmia bicornis bicornis]|uniref:uncharacterized protein LOC123987949 n=1 Tax=Osmia bicornis bicornis TaxID=1437191 RepID=UPI001EAF2551|nr:uncharacterized protein LOC123987949 [Osmia bicornis bicornis]